MSEKRNSKRNPAFLGGTITYNRDLWSADCVVKNLSDNGAKLSGRNLPVLPDQFDLAIPQRKTKYRVQVRWRVGDQIGVSFEHEYTGNELPGAKARQLMRALSIGDEAPPERIVTDFAV